jgi:hypothetical protein
MTTNCVHCAASQAPTVSIEHRLSTRNHRADGTSPDREQRTSSLRSLMFLADRVKRHRPAPCPHSPPPCCLQISQWGKSLSVRRRSHFVTIWSLTPASSVRIQPGRPPAKGRPAPREGEWPLSFAEILAAAHHVSGSACLLLDFGECCRSNSWGAGAAGGAQGALNDSRRGRRGARF